MDEVNWHDSSELKFTPAEDRNPHKYQSLQVILLCGIMLASNRLRQMKILGMEAYENLNSDHNFSPQVQVLRLLDS